MVLPFGPVSLFYGCLYFFGPEGCRFQVRFPVVFWFARSRDADGIVKSVGECSFYVVKV